MEYNGHNEGITPTLCTLYSLYTLYSLIITIVLPQKVNAYHGKQKIGSVLLWDSVRKKDKQKITLGGKYLTYCTNRFFFSIFKLALAETFFYLLFIEGKKGYNKTHSF